MLVTRHKRLIGEPTTRHKTLDIERTDQENLLSLSHYFIDWITIKQSHELPLPVITDGCIQSINADGVLQFQTHRAKRIEGSYDTSMSIRCDGHTVIFSGNISRFGEPDNVFGLDLQTAIRKLNLVIEKLGIPPFTAGQRMIIAKTVYGERTGAIAWTGATISRLDCTQNYITGSHENAKAYLEYLSTQQGSARTQVGTHGDGETVDWNRGSRRVYQKVYIKATELIKHKNETPMMHFCQDNGLIRNEVTYKATQLQTMSCYYLGGFDMKQLELDLSQRQSILTRATADVDDLDTLPNHFRRTARDYLAGDDVRTNLSLATFKRHRKAILPYGIDISVKRNVINFRPKVRVIQLQPVVQSDYEQYLENFNNRLAA